MPTSMTVAPGLTNFSVTNAGRPMAETRMSASAATAGRSGVREWQIVTVACRCSSSSAIGLPTMSLRPMTTARFPAIAIPDRSQQLDDAQRGARDEPRSILHEQSDVGGMEPINVLVGPDRVEHLPLGVRPHRLGQRGLDENAVVRVAPIQPLDELEKLRQGRRRGQALEIRPQTRLSGGLQLAADVNLRGGILADEHDAEPRRSPDAGAKGLDLRRDLRSNLIRDGDAVKQSCGHR